MRYGHRVIFSACVLLVAATASVCAAAWEATLDPLVRGSAAAVARSARLQYSFGWNGIPAASGDVRLGKASGGRIQFAAHGGTSGLARALWKYEVDHVAYLDAQTLRPLEIKEVSDMRSKHVTTSLTFTPDGVTSVREEKNKGKVNLKTRRFDFPNVLSINSALLYLRTQPLTVGAVHRVVVYPATSAYLCTVTVAGRDRISVPTGTYDALKLDVQLKKIGDNRELLPHKKVKNATVWLSDDPNRVVLRIETQVFIGSVFAELQSIEFEDAPQ
jgi:hypothetical protein